MKEEKIIVEITGMTCDHCATGIEKLVKGMEGVEEANVLFQSGKGEIIFNSDKTSMDKIVGAINKTKNYRVSKVVSNGSKENVTKTHFDLIIIGGGSAATSASIRANELGLTTLLVNGGLPIGGTCVNVGCVPSKFLIRAAESIHTSSNSKFKGITPSKPDVDFKKIIQQKKELVAELQQKKYIDILQTLENVKVLEGIAEFVDEKTILVNGKEKYTAIKFLVSTGATTHIPLIDGLDKIGYLTNTTLFDLEEKPESITIMGAGYIGLEIAMAYNRLGVKVRVIEFTDRVLRATQTPDISAELEKHMKNEGIEFYPNFRAIKFEKSGSDTIIHCKCADGSVTKYVERGFVVVATGTTPNTKKLGAEKIGLRLTKSGHIQVNEKMETNLAHIFAAGDVANTPPFVYTAAYEAKIAVENAFTGANLKTDYSAMPWVVFTDPQVAGVGIDEKEAEAKNIPFDVSVLPMSAVPRCIAAMDTRGFIKLIRNPETDKLLGARIVAPEGSELVMEIALAIKYGITVGDLSKMMHPYLTLSEAVKLAAISFGKEVGSLSCCAS
jgi:mercuric reductase